MVGGVQGGVMHELRLSTSVIEDVVLLDNSIDYK